MTRRALREAGHSFAIGGEEVAFQDVMTVVAAQAQVSPVIEPVDVGPTEAADVALEAGTDVAAFEAEVGELVAFEAEADELAAFDAATPDVVELEAGTHEELAAFDAATPDVVELEAGTHEELAAFDAATPDVVAEAEAVLAATELAPTRRARRAAGDTRGRERARATKSKRHSGVVATSTKHVARTALLVALGVPSLGIPAFGILPADADASSGTFERTADFASSISTLDVLTAPQSAGPDPALLPAVPVGEVSLAASRTDIRTVLPGCDGMTRPLGSNGQLRVADLCELDWAPGERLRADAAVALAELNVAFQANFGYPLCFRSTYRDLAGQYTSRYNYGYMAAKPGTSNHGWGLAVDFCNDVTDNSDAMAWLRQNGPTFGWDNPDWAKNPSSPYFKREPWHWEYTAGVIELGNNW